MPKCSMKSQNIELHKNRAKIALCPILFTFTPRGAWRKRRDSILDKKRSQIVNERAIKLP